MTTCTPISSRCGDRRIEDRLFAALAPLDGAFSLRRHQQLYCIWPVMRHLIRYCYRKISIFRSLCGLYCFVRGRVEYKTWNLFSSVHRAKGRRSDSSTRCLRFSISREAALGINEKAAGQETCTSAMESRFELERWKSSPHRCSGV